MNKLTSVLLVVGLVVVATGGYWLGAQKIQYVQFGAQDPTELFNEKTFHNTVDFKSELTLSNCGTGTWNPGAAAPGGATTSTVSTTVAVSGAAVGDMCLASLSTATATDKAYYVSCLFAQAATATIMVTNYESTALDLATGTAKVCYFD